MLILSFGFATSFRHPVAPEGLARFALRRFALPGHRTLTKRQLLSALQTLRRFRLHAAVLLFKRSAPLTRLSALLWQPLFGLPFPEFFVYSFSLSKNRSPLFKGAEMEPSFGLWPRVPFHPCRSCRFSLKAFPTCSATAREIRFTSCPFGQVLKKHRLR